MRLPPKSSSRPLPTGPLEAHNRARKFLELMMSSERRAPVVDFNAPTWPAELHRILKAADVRQMAYVPDAGHAALIEFFHADADVTCNVLTTEEEGVAIAAGAWLGGQRSVLLMQSSGVGNCINMLSLPAIARFPLLMLVTMRGEWAEFNPWQVPMGQATQKSLEAIGIRVMRAETPEDLVETVQSAAMLAYEADQ